MRRSSAILGSFVFLLMAPGCFAGLLPWRITRWQLHSGVPAAVRVLGVVLIIAGIPPLLDSFARFALQGLGTPAPLAPPRKLVVTGFYRYVRNPMYVGVVTVVLGQVLLFGSVRLFAYLIVVFLAMHAFAVFYEEPTLARTFGEQYRVYRDNVPRWIPRRTAWKQKSSEI